MAKLIDLFTFSGRMGDLVGCKGPTGYYLRSRPRKSTKPPTAKQLEMRAKMTLAMAFLNPLREIVYMGFSDRKNRANKTSALNRAVSHFTRYALQGEYPDIYVNPAEVRLTQGDLLQLPEAEIRLNSGGSLQVSWNPLADRWRAFDDDRVIAVAYQDVTKSLVVGESQRCKGLLSMDIFMEPAGTEWLVYGCVAERNFSRFANSQFLGKIVVGNE